jgi:lysophospholipase L1-like esterase
LRYRRVAAGVAATFVVGLAACTADPPASTVIQCASGEIVQADVTILGDSLSVEAQDQYHAALESVVVDACNGRTIVTPLSSDDGLRRVAPLGATEAEWWIVELGTNDAGYGGRPPATVRADAARLLDSIGRGACVGWVLPAVTAPVSPATIENVVAAQQAIAAEVSTLECNRIIDWPAAVASEPGLIAADGVHLTDAGRRRMAELVGEAVQGE